MPRQPLGFVTILLLLKMVTVHSFSTKTCTGNAANIMFVLDSSNSIWIVDYEKQLNFVEKLVKTFDIGPEKDQVRVSAITFSSFPHLEFSLDQHTNQQSLSRAISAVPYRTGSTNTAAALSLLRREIKRRIKTTTVPFIAIVITDGLSTDPKATRDEAKRLHGLGIVVYAIGVGNYYHLDELNIIASDPVENVFEVSSYSALEGLAQTLNIKTCKDIEITTTTTTTATTTRTTTMRTTTRTPTTTTTTSAPTTTTTTTTPAPTTTTTTTTPAPTTQAVTTTTPSTTTSTPPARTTTTTTTTTEPITTTPPAPSTTISRPERPQRDKKSSVSFGYDLMTMGAYRAHMISQFISSLLPYTGYGKFGVVSYSVCPETMNIPVTSLMNTTAEEASHSIPTNNRMPDLSDVVYKMRKDLHSTNLQNFRRGQKSRQNAVLFVDPAVTTISSRLIRETRRLKRQGSKLFVINVGQVQWSQPYRLYTMSSHPPSNYVYSFPTYNHLLHRVRHTPFKFRALCNGYVPSYYY